VIGGSMRPPLSSGLPSRGEQGYGVSEGRGPGIGAALIDVEPTATRGNGGGRLPAPCPGITDLDCPGGAFQSHWSGEFAGAWGSDSRTASWLWPRQCPRHIKSCG